MSGMIFEARNELFDYQVGIILSLFFFSFLVGGIVW